MKKAILFSLMLAGSSLNADLVQPKLPDNVNCDAIQQLIAKIENNELKQEELELLLQAQDEAPMLGAETLAWYALYTIFAGVFVYTVGNCCATVQNEIDELRNKNGRINAGQ